LLHAPDNDWRPIVSAFAASEAGVSLAAFLAARAAAGAVIYPPDPLRALRLTSLAATRVVILGQDPYHGPGQAHGLAFSVPAGVPMPPSLRNIFAELAADVGCARPVSGDLSGWAAQGVLLLNTVLTVEQGEPAAHAGCGWEQLTGALIDELARDSAARVFLLWGAHAQSHRARIESAGGPHAVLCANHPSPLAARRGATPFLGCRHFSQANALLRRLGRGEIDWCGTAA
jgi:uracil-DNA glycosylase